MEMYYSYNTRVYTLNSSHQYFLLKYCKELNYVNSTIARPDSRPIFLDLEITEQDSP
jgi:hypothetical protein